MDWRTGRHRRRGKKGIRNRNRAATKAGPALHVVVYRKPGPEEDEIADHAQTVAQARSTCGTGGGVGYVTLFEPDFDRVWRGVHRGETLPTAYGVLLLLGPKVEQFIGQETHFLFDWISGVDETYGKILLLQIIPRPHLLAIMN